MTLLAALGWLGNACFFSRSLLQWVLSERVGRSVSPPMFWRLSLAGSVLLGVYAVGAGAPVLLVGFVINGGIYVRNLALLNGRTCAARSVTAQRGLWILAMGLLAAAGVWHVRTGTDLGLMWLACAIVGQAIWSTRFVVQWWSSERRGESHFPAAFWWTSLCGNMLLLAYAMRLQDPVFIAGYVLGPFVQVRNLMMATAPRSTRELA